MNEYLRPASLPGTTQAAEGLPRRRWSVGEIEAAVKTGIIAEDERFELIGGDVVPMSPRGLRHELVKAALQQHWFPLIVGSPIDLITETTLYVSEDEFREPDFPLLAPLHPAEGRDGRLSAAHRRGRRYESRLRSWHKGPGLRALGLPELWVINAKTLSHDHPPSAGAGGLPEPLEAGPSELIEPILAPHLAVRLTDLGLTPAT